MRDLTPRQPVIAAVTSIIKVGVSYRANVLIVNVKLFGDQEKLYKSVIIHVIHSVECLWQC